MGINFGSLFDFKTKRNYLQDNFSIVHTKIISVHTTVCNVFTTTDNKYVSHKHIRKVFFKHVNFFFLFTHNNIFY